MHIRIGDSAASGGIMYGPVRCMRVISRKFGENRVALIATYVGEN